MIPVDFQETAEVSLSVLCRNTSRKSMLETLRRPKRLSVALPASFTKDIPHLREKTSRAGMLARALAIFRVDEAIIYDDVGGRISEREGRLLQKLLSYQETPQYMRRAL